MRRDVFQAIADPTRRDILGMVAHGPLNINAVSENFDVSRTAIYKHLKILVECGLVEIEQKGRERFCEAKLSRLKEVYDWVEHYRIFWNKKLDSLDSYLNQIQSPKKAGSKTASLKSKTKNAKSKTPKIK